MKRFVMPAATLFAFTSLGLITPTCGPKAGAQEVSTPQRIELKALGRGDETDLILSGRMIGAQSGTQDSLLTEQEQSLMTALRQQETDETKSSRTKELIEKLQDLQEKAANAIRLDEALAVREGIRDFRLKMAGVTVGPYSLTAFRDRVGETLLFLVVGRRNGAVWGNSVFTDDSDPGTAAVQAGIVKPDQKAVVRVTFVTGLEAYHGATQNGITSQDYGPWPAGYLMEKAPGFSFPQPASLPENAKSVLADLAKLQPDASLFRKGLTQLANLEIASARAGKLDEAVAIRDKIGTLLGKSVGASEFPGSLTDFRDHVGESAVFYLTGRSSGSVWGNGIYTDDSDPGTAAVHSGLLHPSQRGIVRVTLLPGQSSYEGSSRHGIVSRPYQNWAGSYRMELLYTH